MPQPNPVADFFWRSGADGKLRFLRCRACGYYIHPPSPVCPACFQRDVAPEPVSGRGALYSYTVNYQRWSPDLEVPYVLGLVSLPEQGGLRMASKVVNCRIDEVRFEMPVRVVFARHDDLYLPYFEPA
jgi:uncharacterized protein